MKLSRTAIIAAVAALASAGALAVTAAGPAAAVDNVTGTGTITCSSGYTGTFTFTPALMNGGTSGTEEVGVKLKFNTCTGGTPNPTSGTYVAKGVVKGTGANNCANWFPLWVGSTPGFATRTFNAAPLDGDVAWVPTNINDSNVRFNNMRIKTGAGTYHRLAFFLPNTGSGVVTGSYISTSNLTLLVSTAQNYPALATACGSSSGVPSVNIVQSFGSYNSTGTW